jgi:phosphoribosylamine--glycine ligase
MKILVIGSGGREHAIAWKLANSKNVEKVYVAPGNGGTALEKKCENVDINPLDFEKLANFAHTNHIAITFVGPEVPLSEGIVDFFENKNLNIIGPNKKAAAIESSKIFAKTLMIDANIPTGSFKLADNYNNAINEINNLNFPLVLKYDGLAQGKGVFIATDKKSAEKWLYEIFKEAKFGENPLVLIEEYLVGIEASYMALTDGEHILPLATSQDHKQIYDNDKGPNTGGMGAYSPAPVLEGDNAKFTLKNVINPLIKILQKKGITYKGFIYAGLMITNNGIKVLEFNCRLGDPETQPILMRMKSDFLEITHFCLENKLNKIQVEWDEKFSVTVVMASKGYPGAYERGYEIRGLELFTNNRDIKVFHSGTKLENNKIITNGGRVLSVTAKDKEIKEAIKKAYDTVKKIYFKNAYYRTDIGYKALRGEKL